MGADMTFMLAEPEVLEDRDPDLLILVPRGRAEISRTRRGKMPLGPLVQQIRKLDARVIVLSHDRRPHCRDDEAAKHLAARLKAELVLPTNLAQVQGYYQQAAMVASMRMHGCLLGMRAGAAAVMLSEYRDKAVGQFKHFGVPHLVFQDYQQDVERLPQIWAERVRIQAQVRLSLPHVQTSAGMHFSWHR